MCILLIVFTDDQTWYIEHEIIIYLSIMFN